MSALHPKAAATIADRRIRLGPQADIALAALFEMKEAADFFSHARNRDKPRCSGGRMFFSLAGYVIEKSTLGAISPLPPPKPSAGNGINASNGAATRTWV
jgi:hypothetical protein